MDAKTTEGPGPPAPWPAGYPAELVETALLDDGTRVLLRPVLPEDYARFERLHARLSPESLYRRFLSPVPRFQPVLATHLVTVDYRDRMAIVALAGDEIVGVGRYDRVADDVAEVAVIVEDAWQGRGIATRLLWRISAAARARGIEVFVADVLGDNRPMMNLLAVIATELETHLADGQYRVRMRLAPPES